ncbi:MAG: hypothetical protein C1943_11395 [Halochromatium sp.]|nr:hypothetical protein [Halochromatium sp.]
MPRSRLCRGRWWWSMLPLSICMALLVWGSTASARAFSPTEDLVQQAYLAYYGRPGDPAGLAYWSQQLDAAGGSLDAIIQAFGDSREFRERYGALSNEALVDGLYQQLLGRPAEPAGLAFYVDRLGSGEATLQTIALDVIFGAANEDALTVENRLEVSRHYISRLEQRFGPEADVPAETLKGLVTPVTSAAATVIPALQAVDQLIAAMPSYQHSFQVTKAVDTADGSCDSDCSLREALMAANRSPGYDLVQIPAGLYALTLNGPADQADDYQDLEITEPVHLQGAGATATLLDGGGWTRLLEVRAGVSGHGALVTDLKLSGGFSAYGGAVFNSGLLELKRVTLTENTGFNGGAILNRGTLILKNSELRNNDAIPDAGPTGYGGGAWNEGTGTLTVDGSLISGNGAHNSGGGLYSAGTLTIIASEISDNMAGAAGGGLYNVGSLELRTTELLRNAANDGGAVASQEGGQASFRDCTIANNSATGLDLGGGGGLFNYAGTMTLDGCTLRNNIAFGEGGGAIETNGPLTLRNSILENNRANGHDATQLPGDTAPGFGGALLIIAGSQVDLSETRFSSNVADLSGGAIYNDRATRLTLTNVDIQSNRAGQNYGGGISNEGNLTMIGGSLTQNTAPVHGGALASNLGVVRLESVRVTANSSANAGAIGNYLGGQMTLVDNQIESNQATDGIGGGIVNDRDGRLVVQNGRIADNTARTSGGGLYNTAGATLELVTVTLDGNHVTGVNGGGLTNEGSATISGGVVSNNSSPQQAGGIICNGGDLTIQDAQISGNQSGNGGGLSNSNGCLTRLERTLVQNNQATAGSSFGGGLLNDRGTVQLIDSTLSGNSSVFAGGGFANNNTSGLIEVIGTNITGNTAADGEAFVNFGTISVSRSSISGSCTNHASLQDLGGNGPLCGP